MPEMIHTADGHLYVLPRGGKYFPAVLTLLQPADPCRLDACAAEWPDDNLAAVTEIKQQFSAHPADRHWLACETAFFASLPEYAAEYALPAQTRAAGISRFGADGLTHAWVAGKFPAARRLISVCLGENISLAAILDRKAVETSCGYSRLEGLPGMTTCGDVDPSVVLSMAEAGISPAEVEKILQEQSGWLALLPGKISFEQFLSTPNADYEPAQAMLCHGVIKCLGALLAVLGGADRIVFASQSPSTCEKLFQRVRSHFAFAGLEFNLVSIDRTSLLKELLRSTKLDQSHSLSCKKNH